MSSWYEEDWYAPLKREDEDSPDAEEEGKKHRRIRIVGIVLVAAILLNAAAFAFSPMMRSIRSGDRGFLQTEDPEEEEKEYPENYNDFFEEFYTSVETDSAEVNIPKGTDPIHFSVQIGEAQGEELTLQQLYQKCAKITVGIAGYRNNVAGYNWGTGVILSEDGLILTNTHVIDGCDSAAVILPDDSEHEAVLIGADAISDLAVLKIEASDLPYAEFGDSTLLSVGDRVAAIGNPLGNEFTGTLTDGIVSAIDRDISYNGRSMTLLQTNTALNEGNSGGPLFNMFGQVIGITNMKMMSTLSSIEGIGFAIPSSTVRTVVESLITYGEVKGRPSIGITVGQIPQNVADYYDMPEGLYVASVVKGSDAEKQGIREGDVITAANGTPVVTTAEVNDIKNELSVGDQMTFSVWRDGEELEITITLMETNDLY